MPNQVTFPLIGNDYPPTHHPAKLNFRNVRSHLHVHFQPFCVLHAAVLSLPFGMIWCQSFAPTLSFLPCFLQLVLCPAALQLLCCAGVPASLCSRLPCQCFGFSCFPSGSLYCPVCCLAVAVAVLFFFPPFCRALCRLLSQFLVFSPAGLSLQVLLCFGIACGLEMVFTAKLTLNYIKN